MIGGCNAHNRNQQQLINSIRWALSLRCRGELPAKGNAHLAKSPSRGIKGIASGTTNDGSSKVRNPIGESVDDRSGSDLRWAFDAKARQFVWGFFWLSNGSPKNSYQFMAGQILCGEDGDESGFQKQEQWWLELRRARLTPWDGCRVMGPALWWGRKGFSLDGLGWGGAFGPGPAGT